MPSASGTLDGSWHLRSAGDECTRRGQTAAGHSKRKAAAQKEKSTSFINNHDMDASRKLAFVGESKSLETLQPLLYPPTEAWVMRNTQEQYLRQRKTAEESFMTQQKLPLHAGYLNLATFHPDFPAPKWWRKDDGTTLKEEWFKVVEAPKVQQSAERAQIVTEAAARRMTGQTRASPTSLRSTTTSKMTTTFRSSTTRTDQPWPSIPIAMGKHVGQTTCQGQSCDSTLC